MSRYFTLPTDPYPHYSAYPYILRIQVNTFVNYVYYDEKHLSPYFYIYIIDIDPPGKKKLIWKCCV